MNRLAGLVFVLGLAACGTDSSADAFIGTWQYNAGSTATRDCPDNTLDLTTPLSGSFQLAAGTMSDLIEVPSSGDQCPAQKFDVKGKTATIVPGQTCMYTDNTVSPPIMVSIAFATGTYTMSGSMITGTQMGSVTYTATGGNTTCTLSGTLSATKVGN